MGRVTASQMREKKMVRGGGGMPFFKWEPGNKYKIVFPSLPDDQDVFAFEEAVHNVSVGGKFNRVRCVRESHQVSDESRQEVVKVDENGEFLRDPNSGRVLNDGTCPLCEMEYLYRQWIFSEKEQLVEENPDMEDKEVKEWMKKKFDSSPVSSSNNYNRETKESTLVTSKVILAVVYELDEKNKYVLDEEGYPVYSIAAFDMSDSRYRKLASAAENNKEYLGEAISEITDEFGIAWAEFIFDFPKGDSKAQVGKDMTINPIPSSHSAVEKHPDLKKKIEEDLEATDYEKIFAELPSMKVRTIPEMEQMLQGRLEKYRELMSEDEKEELEKSISEEEKTLSGEDAEKMLDEDLKGGSDDLTEKEESDEESFLA